MAKSTGRPTSMDVAREAGVAQSTVSYVISGSKHANRISPETKRRILAVAQRLGYSRNSVGAALRRGYSDTLVVLAVTWRLAAAHSHTTISLSQAAAERGMHTIVHVASDDDEAMAFLENVQSLNPFGLLLLWDYCAPNWARLLHRIPQGLPVVDLMPAGDPMIISVTADRKQGMYVATRHLIELGHRRIGMTLEFISRSRPSIEKLAGYRNALADAGIEYHETLIQEITSHDFEAGQEGMRELIKRSPDVTAVLCGHDPMALGAISALKNLGLNVPGDLSVVGYGAHAEGIYFSPTLTTLGIPATKLAEDAVDTLVAMRTDDKYVPEPMYEPMELIVRESTGPVRSETHCTTNKQYKKPANPISRPSAGRLKADQSPQ